jgi:DNA primase
MGFTPDELACAGVLVKRRGLYTDSMRGRLVFPLLDPAGRTVGFAGRSLDGSEPKYLNTPASPLGGRGSVLFGLPQAAASIRRRGEAWVVEGYFDVLACHQAGLRWVVAACGVALTVGQALVLRRYASRAVLLYDPDAREEAVERACGNLREVGIEVAVGDLPGGADPDEVVLREGPEALAAAAKEARPC